MTILRTISEISINKPALIIFTRGKSLLLDEDVAICGNWKVDPQKTVKDVIIYLRKNSNYIYQGSFIKYELSEEENRYKVFIKNLIKVGTTFSNWKEFAKGGQNPTQYIY